MADTQVLEIVNSYQLMIMTNPNTLRLYILTLVTISIILLNVSCKSQTGIGLPLSYSGPGADAPITLSVKDAKLSDVLMWIADQAGLTSDMRIPDDNITMSVKGAKLSDIMNDLCYAYGCEWRIDSGKLVVIGRKD